MKRSEFIEQLNAINTGHPDPDVFFTVENAQHGTCMLTFKEVIEGVSELSSYCPVGQELSDPTFIDVLLTIRNKRG